MESVSWFCEAGVNGVKVALSVLFFYLECKYKKRGKRGRGEEGKRIRGEEGRIWGEAFGKGFLYWPFTRPIWVRTIPYRLLGRDNGPRAGREGEGKGGRRKGRRERRGRYRNVFQHTVALSPLRQVRHRSASSI